jgi:ubiquinone/menaquinone biosynthesis C-methylase UbiE
MPVEKIFEHWSSQAAQHGLDPASSWSDRRAIELEIAAISAHLGSGLHILDAGCGSGYSSARYAALDDSRVVGVDYVPQMVEHALERRAHLPSNIAERLEFHVGDVRKLDFSDQTFDRVIATRAVINLGTRPEQAQALHEFGRVLRSGGFLLLSDATSQGLERLNALRAEWGLAAIPQPDFNLYLDEAELELAAGAELELVAVENFASSYFVATRVLKPLLAKVSDTEIDVADPDAEFNRWAAQLPAAGDYGTQKLFVFRKRV